MNWRKRSLQILENLIVVRNAFTSNVLTPAAAVLLSIGAGNTSIILVSLLTGTSAMIL